MPYITLKILLEQVENEASEAFLLGFFCFILVNDERMDIFSKKLILNINTSNKTIVLLSYALMYALAITLITFGLERLPVFLQMENAVYDGFQKILTVDEITDQAYDKYQNELEEIVFINLDSIFFDLETDRIRRDSLSFLIEKLKQEPDIKGILLDFLFVGLDNNTPDQLRKDSLLIQHLNSLKSLLVLPYEIEFDTIPVWGELSSNNIHASDSLLFKTDHTGYIAAMPSIGDECYRYVKIRMGDNSHESAVHALLGVLSNGNAQIYTRKMPLNFEVNYILRNQEKRAIPIIDASKLMAWREGQLKTRLKDKIIFIGLFDQFDNKYGLTIDKFETAVQKDMPGIYVLVNSYLNVVTKSYIRRAPNVLVFILNFILALIGAAYYRQLNRTELKSWIRILSETILSFLFFLLFFFFLFLWTYIKFPIVITTLAFVRNQYFYSWFHQKVLIRY